MSVKVEKLEGGLAKLTIEIDAAKFEENVNKVYNKTKGQIQIPGFRKGKAPRKMIEKIYGEAVFYEDAANETINGTYFEEAKSCGEEITSQPFDITVEQIGKDKNFIYTAKVALKPEVKLGEYKGLEYTAADLTASEDEINEVIESERKKNAKTVKEPGKVIENGDRISLDFDGYTDGVQFEGGKADDYGLTVGSHSFIAGFEEQLIGHKAGDEFDVNVTFPEDYNKDLAGKDATFKVKIRSVDILPEVDDEFASNVSDFETLEEYKADIKKDLEAKKAQQAKEDAKNELIKKAYENAEMFIPEIMIEEQAKVAVQGMENQLAQQFGMSIEQFYQMTNSNAETYLNAQKPEAENILRSRLVLEAIAKAEGIEATEEDIEKQFEEMAEVYTGLSVERIKELYKGEALEDLKADILVNKASDVLYENGVAVEAKEETPAEEAKTEE